MRKSRCLNLIVILLAILPLVACVSAQSPLHKVGSLNTGTAYRVFVQGDYAYVATNDGAVVIDIHDRSRPKKTALIPTKEAAFGVYAKDDWVYIAGPVDGLVIANVQDKAAPKIVGSYVGGGINEICVDGQTAYASTQGDVLQIINIADPAKPGLLGTYPAQGGIGLMVACLQDIVYFSGSDKGLDVVDVSDPTTPVMEMTVPRTQGAKDTQIAGDFMYLACVGNGVRILDFADPLLPRTIASFNDGGEAWGVGGDSKYMWIGDLKEGVKLYDVSNPRSPVLIAQDPGYAPHDVFFDGQYTYLADQDKGFIILEYVEELQK
jgi:hypothetical protein